MATLTHQITAVATDAAEYAEIISDLDAYEADPDKIPLDSRVEDEPNLTVTYSVVMEQAI